MIDGKIVYSPDRLATFIDLGDEALREFAAFIDNLRIHPTHFL
jgi:hypothetical protein